MNPFQPFLDAFGERHDCKPAPPERSTSYKGKLPELLLEFWDTEGYCGYRNGMFWFVDPDEYYEVLEEWKVVEHIVFARNGFGDLFLWTANGLSILNVHLGDIYSIGSSRLDNFLNKLLIRESIINDLLYGKLYDKVVKKLGRIAPDECYTFVPALALGGSGTVDSVQRVKLKEQLSILAQIHGR
jgi:hypothetical protein